MAGDDYETVSGGTATFAVGEQIKTFPVTVCSDAIVEGDETLFLNVNSAPGATIVDGQGLGTITANVAGTTLISELRTSGPAGAGDDFVEIYNNTDTPLTGSGRVVMVSSREAQTAMPCPCWSEPFRRRR